MRWHCNSWVVCEGGTNAEKDALGQVEMPQLVRGNKNSKDEKAMYFATMDVQEAASLETNRTCVENEARMRDTVMMTVPAKAVMRNPKRSAAMPARNPARYVTADPVVPTNAIEDAVALGKTVW